MNVRFRSPDLTAGCARRRGRALAGAVLAATVIVAAAAPAGAAPNPYPQTPLDLWGQDGTAYAVEIVGNTAYIGGNFANAARYTQSAPRGNLMALTMDAQPPSASLSGFNGDGRFNTNGPVRALVADGGWLYVGGDFTTIGGTPRNRLARINLANGTVDPGFNVNVNKPVRDLLVANGLLYMVGDFTKVGNVNRKRAAAVSTADGTLSGFDPNLSNKTYAVAYSAPDRILLGGNFTTVGGTARSFLAAVNAGTGALFTQTTFNSITDIVLDLVVGGDRVFAAADGGFNSAAAWNVNGGARIWRQQANGDVQAITYANGNVYFGFHDGFGGDPTLRLLAADAISGTIVPGFAPASSGSIGVTALDTAGPYLVSGGKFPKMGGVNVKGVSVHR